LYFNFRSIANTNKKQEMPGASKRKGKQGKSAEQNKEKTIEERNRKILEKLVSLRYDCKVRVVP